MQQFAQHILVSGLLLTGYFEASSGSATWLSGVGNQGSMSDFKKIGTCSPTALFRTIIINLSECGAVW